MSLNRVDIVGLGMYLLGMMVGWMLNDIFDGNAFYAWLCGKNKMSDQTKISEEPMRVIVTGVGLQALIDNATHPAIKACLVELLTLRKSHAARGSSKRVRQCDNQQ